MSERMHIDDLRARAGEETMRRIGDAFAEGLRVGEEQAIALLSERIAAELPKLVATELPNMIRTLLSAAGGLAGEAATPVHAEPVETAKPAPAPAVSPPPPAIEPIPGPTDRIRRALSHLLQGGQTTTAPKIMECVNHGAGEADQLTNVQIRTGLKGLLKTGEVIRLSRGEYTRPSSATSGDRRGRPANGTDHQSGGRADMRST